MAYKRALKFADQDFVPGILNTNELYNDIEPPRKILKLNMENPVNLFNANFRSGMQVWDKSLPQYEIVESAQTETSLSQMEITQKILAEPQNGLNRSLKFEQGELLFVCKTISAPIRINHSDLKLRPMQVYTIYDLAKRFQETAESATNNDIIMKEILDNLPLGFSHTYVDRNDDQFKYTGQLVAYSLGGLCDVLNVWNVPLVHGISLYFILFLTKETLEICPYASLLSPFEAKSAPWNDEGGKMLAYLEIGVLCANNARRPLHTTPYPLVTTSSNLDPAQASVVGNMLRVNVLPLQWIYNLEVLNETKDLEENAAGTFIDLKEPSVLKTAQTVITPLDNFIPEVSKTQNTTTQVLDILNNEDNVKVLEVEQLQVLPSLPKVSSNLASDFQNSITPKFKVTGTKKITYKSQDSIVPLNL